MAVFLGIQLIYVAIAVLKIENIHKRVGNAEDLTGCYDYIVVGLGSAGSVMANRLAEDPNIRVLGLEAGGPQSFFTDIPPFYPYLIGSDYDWKFFSVPQKRVGSAFEALLQPRGKVIGGSSTINFMAYNRGNKKYYDNWAENYGAIGWDYKSVLPYFIKAENNSNKEIVDQNTGYHGTEGPIGISSPTNPDPILLEQIQAMNNLGFKTVDINGPQQSGTCIIQNFIKYGLRSSTANAYLEPNPYPNNLFISINSFVTKILFEDLTAVGVEFIKNNKTFIVYADKEVIISAGAVQSPHLLMLSGIGPKNHLDQFGIPCIADLPVGNNLMDHLVILGALFANLKDPSKVISGMPNSISVLDLYQLYANKSGYLSQVPMSLTYYSTKYNNDDSWPNTCLFTRGDIYGIDFTSELALINPLIIDEWIEYYSQAINTRVLTFVPFLAKTKSKGTIRLNSTNPIDPPLIDQNYLSNNEDLENFVEIIRLAFIVMENSSLSSELIIPKIPVPGCTFCTFGPIYECDSYLKCLIQQIGVTGAHLCGTCRMGSVDRNDVVVDEKLRVKGIKDLRVVDCSIIPDIINSNTNAFAIMIGEYGSDIIKADRR